jgi:hypothetical protein
MMLRESVQQTGVEFELSSLSGENAYGTVPHQDLLLDFAEAVVLRDTAAAAALRPKMIKALGRAGYFDACGVIAGFHGFTRIADASGVPLDKRYLADAEDVKAQTGIREFEAA